ncbi:MAG TPA: VWA domain-containing protein, partial [Polyangiaceae bacterium]|nr:VWA domain-containing protein [Polyangiaceae bacterium]
MRFTNPQWFFGLAVALLVALALVWGAVNVVRALRRFGDAGPVDALLSHRVGRRRAVKGTLLVLAVAFGFVALAGPQYGKGTRLVPATNLDVVLVIDYSKSMYARDVSPSRIERAKVEVGRLIKELAGARFGAVAFSGEPLSFPLTSDGGAIAQFFRQLSPNDMPVGGTAIGRALEAARALLKRDPSSERHQKVILLVTDGEDLEGDPVSMARSAAQDKIVVHVVQIGGRTPEPIPYVNEDGTVGGPRTDSNGNVLTTQLTAEGENQLTEIAKAGSGFVVRAAQGETGLPEVTAALKKLMTEELSERVETVYADVFHYPLLLCLLLLLLDSCIAEAPRTRGKRPRLPALGQLALFATLLSLLLSGCQRLEEKLFTRYSPKVDEAIAKLATGDSDTATALLQEYLATGECKEGQIGSSPALRDKASASFDLGLGLFAVAERFGKKFGEEGLATPQGAAQDPTQQQQLAARSQEVDCALQVVRLIASDEKQPVTLRAQAYFLSGNLEFLRGQYQDAVTGYDACLRLVPGNSNDSGLNLGDDAAYNRAIAQRRIAEQEKQQPPQNPDGGAPQDQSEQNQDQQQDDQEQEQDQEQDQQGDQQDQSQEQQQQDKGDSQQDQQQEQQQQQGQGGQQTQASNEQQQQQAAQQKDAPSLSQDERMLDLLEEAPT